MSIYDRQLAVSGGVLHHIGLLLAAEEREGQGGRSAPRPTSLCAWCEEERGRKPPTPQLVSHTICPAHLEALKRDLEHRRHLEQMKAEVERCEPHGRLAA